MKTIRMLAAALTRLGWGPEKNQSGKVIGDTLVLDPSREPNP
jgi:hypothetical protein